MKAYDRIKKIELKQSKGLNEISHFEIEQKDMIQLQEMVDIYSGSMISGTTGAATGAIVALAASGSLPIVTSTLSLAGTLLTIGDIGGAIGIAGTALSTAATMTPLAAIAAPVVLFTGISASMKADENFEKAKAMYAEAEAASEKMKTSETLCVGIIDRSEMFHKLLNDLNDMFTQCVNLLDMVTVEMISQLGREITVTDLTDNEIKLIRVTRALAGAVKAVIDTPILAENGELSDSVQKLHTEIYNSIPEFSKGVKEVKAVDFKKEIMTAKLLKTKLQVIDQTKANQIQTNYVAAYESIGQTRENSVPKAKTPIILSIPVIIVVGICTYGIGSIIMIILRLKKYPERRKSNIAILAVEAFFILMIVFGIVISIYQKPETQVTLESTDKISDEVLNSENVSDKTISLKRNSADKSNEIELQPTDEEISSLFMEREADDQYIYSDIIIEQKKQEDTLFTAKLKCSVKSSEGIKNAEYMLTWNWGDEGWNFDQIHKMQSSLFAPLHEPDDNFVTDCILDKELLLQSGESQEGRIELVDKNWVNADEEYSYIYQYLQIESTKLFETRQKIEAEIKFNQETGCWDYENVLWKYDDKIEKVCTINGIWKGVEYETYEASWKYIIEILSADSDDGTIVINSWCEFTRSDGEVDSIQVCDKEKITFKDGEYAIPVGGYSVDHNASDGMDFTYNYIVEQGKLFVNEENETVYLSVQNPKMSIFMGIEMVPEE